MDGAKSVTDTMNLRNECGRQVFCLRKSFFVRRSESNRNKNLGGSRSNLQ